MICIWMVTIQMLRASWGEPEATLCEALCLWTVQYELHLCGAQ